MSDIELPEPPERQPPEPQEPPDQPEEFQFSHEDYFGLIEELELAEARAVQDSDTDYPSNPIEDDPVELVVEFDTTGITSEDLDFALDEALNAKPRMDRICDHNPLPDLWPDGLCHFKGTKVLLLGLDVYYDFCWRDKVPHGKKRFDRCQGLAAFVAKRAKEGKTSAILLTCKKEFIPDFYYTDTHVVYGVPFDGLQSIKINPAEVHYYRHHATDPEILKQIEGNPDVIKSIVGKNPQVVAQLLAQDNEFLEQLFEQGSQVLNDFVVKKMDQTSIDGWVKQDHSRLDNLKSIITRYQSASDATLTTINELLERLENDEIPSDQILTIIRAIKGKSQLSSIISALAEKTDEISSLPPDDIEQGRRIVAATLRVLTRSVALNELRLLIAEDAVEHEFQTLLDQNWWIFGRQYTGRVDRRNWTVGEITDMVLRGADGYFDIIELKRANERIFIEDHNKMIVSPEVNLVVNQLAHYISRIEKSRDTIRSDYGIDLYKLQGLAVIGNIPQGSEYEDAKRDALRMYNSHLNRIKVITYDELIRIGEEIISANEGEIIYAASLRK